MTERSSSRRRAPVSRREREGRKYRIWGVDRFRKKRLLTASIVGALVLGYYAYHSIREDFIEVYDFVEFDRSGEPALFWISVVFCAGFALYCAYRAVVLGSLLAEKARD